MRKTLTFMLGVLPLLCLANFDDGLPSERTPLSALHAEKRGGLDALPGDAPAVDVSGGEGGHRGPEGVAKGPVLLDEVELHDGGLHPLLEVVDHLHLRTCHNEVDGVGSVGTGGDNGKPLDILGGDGDCIYLVHSVLILGKNDNYLILLVPIVATCDPVIVSGDFTTGADGAGITDFLVDSIQVSVCLLHGLEVVAAEMVAVLAEVVDVKGCTIVVSDDFPFGSVEGRAVVCHLVGHRCFLYPLQRYDIYSIYANNL